MHDTLPLLDAIEFPPLRRSALDTLQVNLGYLCNQSCLHCHVNAGPKRTEVMDTDTVSLVIDAIDRLSVSCLDLTGGAPELNPQFRRLVDAAHEREIDVIDRCNLTVLREPGQGDTAAYLAAHSVRIVASLPCYLEQNVNAQRGDGVFATSIKVLRELNGLGYGVPGSGLQLDLVYNPQGPVLPPPQDGLQADYQRHLSDRFGVRFSSLLTLANMPIKRFGSTLVSRGEFDGYMQLLGASHQEQNMASVMCRSLVSVDWQGRVYDCDFNQMLGLPMQADDERALCIDDLTPALLEQRSIRVAGHCYACTAGQGSSCGGALD